MTCKHFFLLLESERSERDTLRSVQLKIGDILWYVQFQFIARACHMQRALLHPATLGYISVLEFILIESYLKAISSDYGSNKEY